MGPRGLVISVINKGARAGHTLLTPPPGRGSEATGRSTQELSTEMSKAESQCFLITMQLPIT